MRVEAPPIPRWHLPVVVAVGTENNATPGPGGIPTLKATTAPSVQHGDVRRSATAGRGRGDHGSYEQCSESDTDQQTWRPSGQCRDERPRRSPAGQIRSDLASAILNGDSLGGVAVNVLAAEVGAKASED